MVLLLLLPYAVPVDAEFGCSMMGPMATASCPSPSSDDTITSSGRQNRISIIMVLIVDRKDSSIWFGVVLVVTVDVVVPVTVVSECPPVAYGGSDQDDAILNLLEDNNDLEDTNVVVVVLVVDDDVDNDDGPPRR
jgi:prolyl-tRNA synthetase